MRRMIRWPIEAYFHHSMSASTDALVTPMPLSSEWRMASAWPPALHVLLQRHHLTTAVDTSSRRPWNAQQAVDRLHPVPTAAVPGTAGTQVTRASTDRQANARKNLTSVVIRCISMFRSAGPMPPCGGSAASCRGTRGLTNGRTDCGTWSSRTSRAPETGSGTSTTVKYRWWPMKVPTTFRPREPASVSPWEALVEAAEGVGAADPRVRTPERMSAQVRFQRSRQSMSRPRISTVVARQSAACRSRVSRPVLRRSRPWFDHDVLVASIHRSPSRRGCFLMPGTEWSCATARSRRRSGSPDRGARCRCRRAGRRPRPRRGWVRAWATLLRLAPSTTHRSGRRDAPRRSTTSNPPWLDPEGSGPFPRGRGRPVHRAVERNVIEIEADDPRRWCEPFVLESLEDTGGDPRGTGHESDQDASVRNGTTPPTGGWSASAADRATPPRCRR